MRWISVCSVNHYNNILLISVVELAREKLHYIFSRRAYFFEKLGFSFESATVKNLKLPDLLIDISNYNDPRLLQGSLHLLNRFSKQV